MTIACLWGVCGTCEDEHQGGRIFFLKDILLAIQKVGYVCEFILLNSKDLVG